MVNDFMNHGRARWMILIALATAGAVSASGCNTIEGVGEDIKATGEAIDDAAEDAQD